MNEILKKILIQKLDTCQAVLENKRVLDIGCADLRPYSLFLASNALEYKGIDISERFILLAKNRLPGVPNVSLEIGKAESLPYENDSIDIVVCNNMLAYTDKPKAICEILRVLKKGGLCISLYNNTIEYSLMKMVCRQTKPLPKEILHSMVVILNTLCCRWVKKKFFHTTCNSVHELKGLLDSMNVEPLLLETMRIQTACFPIKVINFIFKKE